MLRKYKKIFITKNAKLSNFAAQIDVNWLFSWRISFFFRLFFYLNQLNREQLKKKYYLSCNSYIHYQKKVSLYLFREHIWKFNFNRLKYQVSIIKEMGYSCILVFNLIFRCFFGIFQSEVHVFSSWGKVNASIALPKSHVIRTGFSFCLIFYFCLYTLSEFIYCLDSISVLIFHLIDL